MLVTGGGDQSTDDTLLPPGPTSTSPRSVDTVDRVDPTEVAMSIATAATTTSPPTTVGAAASTTSTAVVTVPATVPEAETTAPASTEPVQSTDVVETSV